MKNRCPEFMRSLPPDHLLWALLEPFGQTLVILQMCLRCILLEHLRRSGVVSCKYLAHYFAEFHVLGEIGCVEGIRRVYPQRAIVGLVKVDVFYKLHVTVCKIDCHRSSQTHRKQAVSGEKGPPYSFVQSFLGKGQHGACHTSVYSDTLSQSDCNPTPVKRCTNTSWILTVPAHENHRLQNHNTVGFKSSII
ncbi:hypothetical protein BJY00DRAFT_289805 [Aspergillus carlsbadensis]|nr:hypothetical protein BJY00DRAFT_289805 [Aspergillus carlsbadensis]